MFSTSSPLAMLLTKQYYEKTLMVNIKSGKGGSFWFFSTQLFVSYL